MHLKNFLQLSLNSCLLRNYSSVFMCLYTRAKWDCWKK